MLTRMRLRNFKCWRDTGEVRLAPITGFFGTNSSGKTSLLQLLLMLKQTAESADRSQVLHLGDPRALVDLGTFRDVVHDHEEPGVLEWELSWRLPRTLEVTDPERRNRVLFKNDEMGFFAEIRERERSSKNASGSLYVERLAYRFDRHVFSMKRKSPGGETYVLGVEPGDFRFKRNKGRPWGLPAPVKCYGFPDQVRAYYQNAGFLSDFELAFEQLLARLYYLGPLREYPQREYTWAGAKPEDMGQRGERVVDALLASREKAEKISRGRGYKRYTVEEYAAHWLQELGLVSEFAVEPIVEGGNLYRVWIRTRDQGSRALITDVGFGISQILPVLVLCYYVPEGSTIIYEQPEIHLHPSVQAGLADVFIDAMRTRKVQVIVESHSEYLLRRLQRRIAEEQVSTDEVSLYFCERRDGESVLVPLRVTPLGDIENWPEGFFADTFSEVAATAEARLRRMEVPPGPCGARQRRR